MKDTSESIGNQAWAASAALIELRHAFYVKRTANEAVVPLAKATGTPATIPPSRRR